MRLHRPGGTEHATIPTAPPHGSAAVAPPNIPAVFLGTPFEPMPDRIDTPTDASALRVGIACSRYHGWATDRLLEGAIERWRRLGGRADALIVALAPGAWELTAIALGLATHGGVDAVVALGAVIRGETPHFEYICQGVARGLTDITLRTGLPVGFGVLTCDTAEQVRERSGGAAGNKGAEALAAAVESALTLHTLRRREAARAQDIGFAGQDAQE